MQRRGDRPAWGWLFRALALVALTASAFVFVAALAPSPARAGVWWRVSVGVEARDGNNVPAQGVPFTIAFDDTFWGNWDEAVVVTGPDGRAGRVQAGFEEDGYPLPYYLDLSDPNGVYTVTSQESDGFGGDPDGAWVHHTYHLADAGVIAGVVRDAQGTPSAYAGVTLFVRDVSGSWQRVVSSQSDTSGRYRFAALSSRDYAVRFAYPLPYGPRFWQGGADPATAGTIALGQDEERTDIDGEPGPPLTSRLTGRVALRRGGGAEGLVVRVWRLGDDGSLVEWPATFLTGEDGVFTADGLDAGTYTVSVDLATRGCRQLWLGNVRRAEDALLLDVGWAEDIAAPDLLLPRGVVRGPRRAR